MQKVSNQIEKPLSSIATAAVAIGIANPSHPHQLHTGVIHRMADGGLRMLHLAWHCVLRNDQPEPQYLCVSLGFDERRLRQLATMCRRIFYKNQQSGVPYGFAPPKDSFDVATGAYLLQESQVGLTCASFVLAVFHAVGLQLADYSSWPTDRPGDRDWQSWVVKMLERDPENAAHAKCIMRDIGSVRFYPQEVAACATIASYGVLAKFNDVEDIAENIRKKCQ